MNENLREKALEKFQEYIGSFCTEHFQFNEVNLSDFIHFIFKKYGIYLINNNSLYLNWEYSFATFEVLNEIIRGEALLNPLTEIDWAQMFAALISCHAARTLGSNANDRFDNAAIPHPKRGIEYAKIDSDSELWKYMIPRATIIAEEICKEFRLINVNFVKNLIQKSDPFTLTKTMGRSYDIVHSSILLPMISDPRLKYKFILLYKDLESGGVLNKLKISDPEKLHKFVTEEFWDTTYLQVFYGLQALEKTSLGKVFLSYLYANVVPNKELSQKLFKRNL